MEFKEMLVLNVEMFGNQFKYYAEFERVPQTGKCVLYKPTKCYKLIEGNQVKSVKIPKVYSKEDNLINAYVLDSVIYFENTLKDEINIIIQDLEKQIEELKQINTKEELEEFKNKSVKSVNYLLDGKQKNKFENIEKCKKDITFYYEKNKDSFKLKNMLYDLKINNKTFYNYQLDVFLKELKEK